MYHNYARTKGQVSSDFYIFNVSLMFEWPLWFMSIHYPMSVQFFIEYFCKSHTWSRINCLWDHMWFVHHSHVVNVTIVNVFCFDREIARFFCLNFQLKKRFCSFFDFFSIAFLYKSGICILSMKLCFIRHLGVAWGCSWIDDSDFKFQTFKLYFHWLFDTGIHTSRIRIV